MNFPKQLFSMLRKMRDQLNQIKTTFLCANSVEDRQKNQELAQLHYRVTVLNNDIDFLEENNSELDQFRIEDDMSQEVCSRFNSIAIASRSGIDIVTVADMYDMNLSEIELAEELCEQRLYTRH